MSEPVCFTRRVPYSETVVEGSSDDIRFDDDGNARAPSESDQDESDQEEES